MKAERRSLFEIKVKTPWTPNSRVSPPDLPPYYAGDTNGLGKLTVFMLRNERHSASVA